MKKKKKKKKNESTYWLAFLGRTGRILFLLIKIRNLSILIFLKNKMTRISQEQNCSATVVIISETFSK